MKKALAFRAGSLGDCLMAKYFLENIKAAYPDARCGIVVGTRAAMVRDLLKAYPWIEIIEVNRAHPYSVLSLIKNWSGTDIAMTQYTKGIFSTGSKIIARLITKPGGLVGFKDSWKFNSLLYSSLLEIDESVSTVEQDRQALRAVGIPISIPDLTLDFIKDSTILNRYNLTEGNYIIVHLYAGNNGRGLSMENKSRLLKLLHIKFGEKYKIILTGGKGDRDDALKASENIPVTIVAGETSIQELINLINSSKGVISVDTGAGHIAAHLKKKLIVLRTCIGKQWWYKDQYNDRPIVCSRDELCAGGHVYIDFPLCINSISMEEVVEKFLL